MSPCDWSAQRTLQGFYLDRGEKRISDMGEPKLLPLEEDSCGEGQWEIQEEERP